MSQAGARAKGNRKPVSKVRSKWHMLEPMEINGVTNVVAQRNVTDGHLTVIFGQDQAGWHLSISHRENSREPIPVRYPVWDEIADARDRFLPEDLAFAMILPKVNEYVALHDTTFHLHQMPEQATNQGETQ